MQPFFLLLSEPTTLYPLTFVYLTFGYLRFLLSFYGLQELVIRSFPLFATIPRYL